MGEWGDLGYCLKQSKYIVSAHDVIRIEWMLKEWNGCFQNVSLCVVDILPPFAYFLYPYINPTFPKSKSFSPGRPYSPNFLRQWFYHFGSHNCGYVRLLHQGLFFWWQFFGSTISLIK